MKAEVIADFYDLETGLGCVPENTYRKGDVFEGTAARVNELVGKGLVVKLPTRKRAAKK
ncbi:MAG: hypothetical protein IKC14_05450 [Kiritimatiellae bacterium]|nr:hypothetical protein [Kiritimatiellia bacterium]